VEGASDGVRRMQWPLLLLCFRLPAVDPRDFSADLPTQIDGRRTVSQLRVGGPELNLIALAPALMATIDSHRDVDRKRCTSIRCGIMKGTTSVPLIASSTRRLETDQRENLLHRDLTTKPVKVNAWHGFSVCSGTVPVPFSIWGTGNGQFSRCQPMGVRRIRPACSRDSSASPRRSFLTDSVSRSLARVSVVPLVSNAITRSWRPVCFSFFRV
jgi:hypothetical protein